MNSKVQFSVLSYCPSVVSGERINIGIVVYNSESKERTFEYITHWKRVEHFDDEVDIDLIKLVVEGIRNEVSESLLSSSEEFSIQEYIRYFVNELSFDSIREYGYNKQHDDFQSVTEYLKKLFLRLDYHRHERLNKDEEKACVKKIIKDRQISYSSKPLVGTYDENIRFDYIVDHRECVKHLKLAGQDLKKLIHHVKSWAFTCEELQSQFRITFVLSDGGIKDHHTEQAIRRILESKGGRVCSYDDYIRNITSSDLRLC